MPKLNGLFEAALFVQNLARARDFYEQVVGLEKLRESEVGCVFIVAERQLLLVIAQEKARVSSKTPGGEVPPCLVRAGETLGAGHIAFAVAEAEFDVWRARLDTSEVQVLSVVNWEAGGRSLYFRDPDGHLIELATPGVWDPDW
jgi:catechol 2,3-dioxygenase-like lactoylglutathione lyase family enzyme